MDNDGATGLNTPDESGDVRHTGESRYPVLAWICLPDLGLRQGDDFVHLRTGSMSIQYVRESPVFLRTVMLRIT